MPTEDLNHQISQVIEEYKDLYAEHYVSVAASVILILDHFLTFGREVNLFWNRRVSGPTVLFILNRYLALIFRIGSLLVFHPFTDQFVHNSCTTLNNTTTVLHYIQPLPPAVFSAMRALALSRSRPLAMLVLVFSLVNVGFNFANPVSVFLVFNTLRMVTSFKGVGNIIISPDQTSLISQFSDPLTTILVSRFLLDLQEAHQRTVKLASEDPLHSSASDFQVGIGSLRLAADAMGSIGADLRILNESHGSEGEDDAEPKRVLPEGLSRATEDADSAE
ncbi:uncharacterized protein BXZ73DRAFT_80267 [Epithele typhae]|uniref:uncharacterized protein n=1 Tax=Epithele typhae TaxID=378194 RepID=UPI002008D4C8|nr:uncharacterized protein BXZ73DRAFT_80267 [Epithele typhae]KAH9919748.1 hypothetical protein BXZ73DRAFT_80267 [Epithele typhae]